MEKPKPAAKKPAVRKPSAKKTDSAGKSEGAKKPTVKSDAKKSAAKKPDVETEESVERPVEPTNEEPTTETVPKPTVEPAAELASKPAKVRTKKVSPIDIAAAKYSENGWTIIKPPKGSVNDFIANRNGRLHFVQVVTKESYEDPKYHGGAKNDFVQNAMSNSAIPVFAHVVGGSKPKVTFQDVNTNNRIIVSQRSAKAEEKK